MADPLAHEPFGWRRAGADRIEITYDGRPITHVRGAPARTATERLQLTEGFPTQQLLARLTGASRQGRGLVRARNRSPTR